MSDARRPEDCAVERTGNKSVARSCFERSFQMSTINARCLKLEFLP